MVNMVTRRTFLRAGAALIAGAAAPLGPLVRTGGAAPGAPAPAADGGVPGWPRYQQDQLGIAFQHPPGWTVRVLENGMPAVAAGRDGLAGARAYGQLFTVKEGTGSATLIFVLASNLAIDLDAFKIVQAVRLSTDPDLSALRYTFNYADGPRKGTLTVQVNKGGGALLGFDAPAGQYAEQAKTLATTIGTFHWFKPTLALYQAVEPKEHAFTAMVPEHWRTNFQVIRPAIDAGFVAGATDPTGRLSVDVHLPQTPFCVTPAQGVPLREGDYYHMGDQWGIQPYLVLRYLPGKEYLRSFVLPQLGRQRPDLRLVGWGDRPDLATNVDSAIAKKVAHGSADGGEAEYVWTAPGGVAMRGRLVTLTILVPGLDGAPGLWFASQLLRAEAPTAQFNEAVAVLTTMNGSLRPDAAWKAAELKGAGDRWRIILNTQKAVFNIYQQVMKNRQDAEEKADEQWDETIRYTFSGGSDYGSYVPLGDDTIMTADGQVVQVVGLGGKSVADWQAAQAKNGGDTYLQKAW